MAGLMFGLGGLLILWGLFVLLTGDFVATLDIAAGLVGWGVGAIGIGALIRTLDRISERLASRPAVRAEPFAASVEEEEPVLPTPRPAAVKPAARKLPPMPEDEVAARTAAPTPAQTPVEPELVREGTIEGRRYRFYSDGSIEAEGPGGVRRYRSIDEAREQILREREEKAPPRAPEPVVPPPSPAQPPSPVAPTIRRAPEPPPARPVVRPPSADFTPPPVRPPETRPPEPRPSEPRAPEPRAPEPRVPETRASEAKPGPASAKEPPKAAGDAVTWESYLAAGADPAPTARPKNAPPPSSSPRPAGPAASTEDDEEWAEPFRMLLRGGSDTPPDDKEPRKR